MKRWMKLAGALFLSATAANAQIFTWTTAGDKTGNSDMSSMVWLNSHGLGDTQSAIAKLQARAAGKRCLFLWSDNHAIFNEAADQLPGKLKSLWWPAGIAKSVAAQKTLVSQMTAAGVKPDYVINDNEDAPNRWNITLANILAIAADPRGAALGVAKSFAPGDETAGLAFDVVAGRASKAAIQQGTFAPLLAYAPNAVTAQFGDFLITTNEGLTVREQNNHAIFSDTLAGNIQNPGIYGGLGLNPQTQSPYAVAVYSENVLRICVGHGNVLPWYSGDSVDKSVWKGTNYWSEAVRHGLLTCGLRGLLFDADQPTAAAKFSVVYLDTKTAIGGTLPTTMCSSETLDPTAPYYVTARADQWDGITPANKIVGRITFAPGVTTATFSVAGRTFTAKPATGQAGAWFSYPTTTTAPSKGTGSARSSSTTTTKTVTTISSPKPRVVPH